MTARVLIVDDSITVRMHLAESFEAAGMRTVPCGSAAEARQITSREEISLVVLDVRLPDGDGIDLLRELRGNPRTEHVPVVLLSSEAEVHDRIRGLTTGADEYVGKPYDVHYLIARARELVNVEERASDAKMSVLVIDDSRTFREILKVSLEAHYDVLTAATGEEGLRIAAEKRPHAIIVDGVLPGMDGATVIRRIRLDAALRRTPCVMLTGTEDSAEELRALDAGADAFIQKSEDMHIALARVGAVLRTARAVAAERTTSSLAGPKKILAVDDSATYLHLLAEALSGEGYDVILARSGEEALEMLAVQPVDCILLDLLMPGIGGHETCRRIKQAPGLRDIPLIMLTALEERQAMLEGLGAGADDYISKSSDLETLRARLRAQLRRRQFEEENRHIRNQLLHAEVEASEARAARELAELRARLVEELEQKNRELESFSYTVSHDLRAPLRAIDGFTAALAEDYGDRFDERAQRYLQRVRAASRRMSELIDDLLELSRVGRAAIHPETIDLTDLVRHVADGLVKSSPERDVRFVIQPDVKAEADVRMMRVALENLLGNAWKFTSRTPHAVIEFTTRDGETGPVYVLSDNGAGFDMASAATLFAPFQRLHSDEDYPGSGIGLATVRRIVERHGGQIWAEGEPGKGARFLWTLGGR
jgi:DNA-binding response OmpR family regulator